MPQGILAANYMKETGDPLWKDDPAYKEWLDFMDRYLPEGDKNNGLSVYRLQRGADPRAGTHAMRQ